MEPTPAQERTKKRLERDLDKLHATMKRAEEEYQTWLNVYEYMFGESERERYEESKQ